jgi:hypothetical protein
VKTAQPVKIYNENGWNEKTKCSRVYPPYLLIMPQPFACRRERPTEAMGAVAPTIIREFFAEGEIATTNGICYFYLYVSLTTPCFGEIKMKKLLLFLLLPSALLAFSCNSSENEILDCSAKCAPALHNQQTYNKCMRACSAQNLKLEKAKTPDVKTAPKKALRKEIPWGPKCAEYIKRTSDFCESEKLDSAALRIGCNITLRTITAMREQMEARQPMPDPLLFEDGCGQGIEAFEKLISKTKSR